MNVFAKIFSEGLHENITFSWKANGRDAVFKPIPNGINNHLILACSDLGIFELYKHQAESIKHILEGRNVVISTGTSSGKSLCYQLPILNSFLTDNDTTALLLFPTKALATDQSKSINNLLTHLNNRIKINEIEKVVGQYDGDTDQYLRKTIRNNSNILITNPDMLHIGILPNHTSWERFLTNLKYIVVDEIHSYSGVFGSHFANVIRRLKRILEFYGAAPQYILTSATISNALDFVERSFEEDFILFDTDYSHQNERTFFFYNPPIVNPELGIRENMQEETQKIAHNVLQKGLQTIIFARTRKTVERFFKRFSTYIDKSKFNISTYRSGYLKKERRAIEADLKSGKLDLVVSTTALELGIDMGMVDVIILMGYPGSITRFLQQSGRAGREENDSLCILIASSSPVDQFIIRHPEYVRFNNPEMVLIDPDNVFILLNHLKCAAFELPFKPGDNYGSLSWEEIAEFFTALKQMGLLYLDRDKFFWKSSQYPANEVSLRSILGNPIQLLVNSNNSLEIIGEIDQLNAKRIVHPGAIYLHKGNSYLVESLDLHESTASLILDKSPFYTDPVIKSDASIENQTAFVENKHHMKGFGDLRIVEQVVEYKRISWEFNQVVAQEELDLESDDLYTKGFWVTFKEELIDHLQKLNLWTNSKINYGPKWKDVKEKILKRDNHTCQNCGLNDVGINLHVHHKIPFRTFSSVSIANNPKNLITLCQRCHRIAEVNVKIKSLLNGFGFAFINIATIFLKCNIHDIGYTVNERIGLEEKKPGIMIFDRFPGGIGLSQSLYDRFDEILHALFDLVKNCPCKDGCPSCVGPSGENGIGAKKGILELLNRINSMK